MSSGTLSLLSLRPINGTPATTAAPRTTLTVTFLIGPQQYGLPVSVVLEVVRLPALIALAGAPATICGLLNLRGQYLPVLDGRTLIGETASYELNAQIIIAGRTQPLFGVLVDQVCDVYQLEESQTTMLQQGTAAPFLHSVIHSAHGSVLLFDFAALSDITRAAATAKEIHHALLSSQTPAEKPVSREHESSYE